MVIGVNCALAPIIAPTGFTIGVGHVYVVVKGTISPLESSGVIENEFSLQIIAS